MFSQQVSRLQSASHGFMFDLVGGVTAANLDLLKEPTTRLQLVTGTGESVRVSVKLVDCPEMHDLSLEVLEDNASNLHTTALGIRNLQVVVDRRGNRTYCSTTSTYVMMLQDVQPGALAVQVNTVHEQLAAQFQAHTVKGVFTVNSPTDPPVEFSCHQDFCKSRSFVRRATSDNAPDGLQCVECGESKRYSLTHKLYGNISTSIGLTVNAVISGDLVKQVLPNIVEVEKSFIADEHSMTYACNLSDIAHEAQYILRGNKVVDILTTIDLTWDSDNEDLLTADVSKPELAGNLSTIEDAKQDSDNITPSIINDSDSATPSSPSTPEA